MTARLMTSAALATILAMSASASIAAPSPQDFIKQAIQGDNSEIALGQLAQQKAGSQQVKDFGQTLVTDHTQAKEQAASVAKQLNVTPPDGMMQDAQDEQNKLSKMSGNDFDKEFATFMVMDHQKDIQQFQEEANANSGPASDLAKQQLPVLQKHLKMAKSLSASDDQSAAGAAPATGAAATTASTTASGAAAAANAPQEANNDWRASKLVGVAIYGPDNKKVGNISDILMSKDGKAELVVVGVGGFLGIGEKDVAIPFEQVKFTDQPEETRAAATTNGTGTKATGTGTQANDSVASNSTASGHAAYPDHGMIEMTAAQLKSAPTFKFPK